MSWEEFGIIGQVMGSIAVFVTLWYLSIQTRQAREEVRRSISFTRGQISRDFFMTMATDERLLAIRIKSQVALGTPPTNPFVLLLMERGLTREEALTTYFEQMALFAGRIPTLQYIDYLPAAERENWDASLRDLYRNREPSRTWYASVKSTLNPDAVSYIDSLLAAPDSTANPS